jgi:L-threonylcarbamoyladenylate synthase
MNNEEKNINTNGKIETKILDVSDINSVNIAASEEGGDDAAFQKLDAALAHVDYAGTIIAGGGTVAFPTETVYGLGADALSEEAVAKIFVAKGRPADNPLIVHIARASEITRLSTKLTPKIVKLIDEFWPGPLTLVLPKTKDVPDIVTAGLPTVGIRMPDDPIALELIKSAGCPIAAPSANISGRPSPTRPEHVISDLAGKVDVILVGGNCKVGIESTVLDMSTDIPTILRPGFITAEDIIEVIGGKVEMDPNIVDQNEAPKAPGMKYTHYAPKAQMTVFEGNRHLVEVEVARVKALNEQCGNKVGVIMFDEGDFVVAAQDFFAKLREFDDQEVDLILAGAMSKKNSLGFAVMNRMMKAAGHNIVKVENK